MSDPEIVRTRTTEGFAVRVMAPEQMNRVRAYLQDGDPRHLEGTGYEAKRRRVLADMTPKQPQPAPVEPLSAEELRKLVPAAGELPDVHVETVDARDAALILVVKNDGKVLFQSTMPPEDLLHLLGHVAEDVEDAIKRRDAGLN